MTTHVTYNSSGRTHLDEMLAVKAQVEKLPLEFLKRCEKMGIQDLQTVITYWTCGE